MENRYIVKDIMRGIKEAFHPGRLVWYLWDRKLERLGIAYYLKQEKAQEICDKKNSGPAKIPDFSLDNSPN